MLVHNRLFVSRLHDIGIMYRQQVIGLGLSGPTARATGVLMDARMTGYEVVVMRVNVIP